MASIDELVTELDKLSSDQLEEVLSRLTSTHAKSATGEAPDKKKAFAIWLARQHLGIDSHIQEVIYLPAGAPENEIRLVEINSKLYLDPADDAIVPVEMTPAVSGLPYKVRVADITPEQWDKVKQHANMLPLGWSLADSVKTGRRRA
jgi:hypothetical protein